MEQNVVVAVFGVESEGYQALTELKNKPVEEGKCVVTEAALIKAEEGKTKVLDLFNSGAHTEDDAVFGGLLGATLGIIGGPIGMLFGAGAGSLLGMGIDTLDEIDETSMLEQIADKLDDGTVAVAIMAYEDWPYVLDDKLSKFDVIIARFDASVVADEVMRAREMQAELERQARLELRQKKEKELEEKSEKKRKEKIAEFKAFCDDIQNDPNFAHYYQKK